MLADHEIKEKLEKILSARDVGEITSAEKIEKTLIQASSLDIRVGEFYVPPNQPPFSRKLSEWIYSFSKPLARHTKVKVHSLYPGETVIVECKEEIRLDKSLSALAFPIASFAAKGIVMTNPGHIDPGYNGKLSFSLINMSRERYSLSVGEKLATLVLFNTSTQAGYSDRNSPDGFHGVTKNLQNIADCLTPDFMDIKAQASSAAAAQVNKVYAFLGITIPVVASLAALLLTYSMTSTDKIADLSKTVSELKQSNEMLEARLKQAQDGLWNVTMRLDVANGPQLVRQTMELESAKQSLQNVTDRLDRIEAGQRQQNSPGAAPSLQNTQPQPR